MELAGNVELSRLMMVTGVMVNANGRGKGDGECESKRAV